MLNELRRLFYPHSSNNYKAGLIQPQGLCVLIAIFLLAQSFLNLSLGFIPGVLGFASNITPGEIIELTNKKRTESGLSPLSVDGQLNEAARQKAADMFALNYWSHVSPRGADPWSFVINTGYRYLYAGENLARDFSHSGGVVEAWMSSPTHRNNVLNGKYQEIGVAVVDGVLQGQETTLVVQMFATPQTKKPTTMAQETTQAVEEEPTATPTVAMVPTTAETEAITATPAVILTQATPEKKGFPWLSGFDLTKSLSLAFAGLLFIVLALDGLIVIRQKKARISGHNFIHGTFMIILILMILLSQQGMIL